MKIKCFKLFLGDEIINRWCIFHLISRFIYHFMDLVDQNWIKKWQIPSIWEKFQLSGSGVKVAVLDTGIDISNLDFNDGVKEIHDFCDPILGIITGSGWEVRQATPTKFTWYD